MLDREFTDFIGNTLSSMMRTSFRNHLEQERLQRPAIFVEIENARHQLLALPSAIRAVCENQLEGIRHWALACPENVGEKFHAGFVEHDITAYTYKVKVVPDSKREDEDYIVIVKEKEGKEDAPNEQAQRRFHEFLNKKIASNYVTEFDEKPPTWTFHKITSVDPVETKTNQESIPAQLAHYRKLNVIQRIPDEARQERKKCR